MQQPQQSVERFDERLASSPRLEGILLLECRLNQLKIPVAVLVPDELVDLAGSLIEAVLVEGRIHLADRAIQSAENPAVGKGAILGRNSLTWAIEIHQNESGGVPDLVGEVPVALDPFFSQLDVTTR